jgi:AraC-like DNA-binding protein
MALVIIRLRHNAGASWMPMGVYLEHRALPCQQDVLRILGPNVHYDCPQNELHIRKSVLDRSAGQADQRLYDLVRQLGDRLLVERRARADIVLQTQQAIVRCLDNGETTLDCAAEKLELTGSALQSRLAASGTTFDAQLQETRIGLAETYLRDTDLPLTDIALLLGFSELSAFTRAAGRWFGMPPSQHRMRLRRQSEPQPENV